MASSPILSYLAPKGPPKNSHGILADNLSSLQPKVQAEGSKVD
jgi:hypothetical protein